MFNLFVSEKTIISNFRKDLKIGCGGGRGGD